jgi:hypothetical protein
MVEPSDEAPRVIKKLVHPFETWWFTSSNANKSIAVTEIFLVIIISFNFFEEGKYNDFGYLKYDLSRAGELVWVNLYSEFLKI